jgi:aldehyde dehydrogenase (NAD+)
LSEYLAPAWLKAASTEAEDTTAKLSALPGEAGSAEAVSSIDRTAKLYIGGKQTRPDSGYSYTVRDPQGMPLGQAGLGNRKDIRNAVEAASKAGAWGGATAHNRAQVLYYVAENLFGRAKEFADRLVAMTGASAEQAAREVEAAVKRTFFYAAWADKYDGQVHATRSRHVTLAMNEPFGVMGLVCPNELPLLGFVSLLMPAIAMGNRAVIVPSSTHPLAATDFYQLLDTSDVPGGVVNIVTGEGDVLAKTLAEHHEVAALWYIGGRTGSAMIEKASASNLKATWVSNGSAWDWWSDQQGQGREYLRRATQVKNIWVPYGE